MHIPWEDLELFLTVAEEHSMSGAARRLSLTQPTVSRRIAALEERLGRPLFRRDVEGAHLTDEGAKLEPAAQEMARFARELSSLASDFDDRPAGIVRLAVPPGTAYDIVVPFAKTLKQSLPDITLHAISSVDYLDLSRGHAELALRAKCPTQPDLMVLGHLKIEMGVFCSAAYAEKLKSTGKRLTPADLDWISWAYPSEHVEPTPTLKKLIPGFSPAFAANDYNVMCRAVSEGLGAMILPRTKYEGSPYPPFVELDVGLPLPLADAYLVCAKAMRWVPRVRAVASELLSMLAAIDGVHCCSE